MGTTIATVNLKPTGMPIDAFVMLTRALTQMPVVEHWDPDTDENVSEPLADENQLLMGNTGAGDYEVSVADDVEHLAGAFTQGHFEIRWVNHG